MFFLIELIHLLSRQTSLINSLIVSIESKKKYETTLLKEYCNVNAFMNFASVQNLHLLIKVCYGSLEFFVAFDEGKKNLENYITLLTMRTDLKNSLCSVTLNYLNFQVHLIEILSEVYRCLF